MVKIIELVFTKLKENLYFYRDTAQIILMLFLISLKEDPNFPFVIP